MKKLRGFKVTLNEFQNLCIKFPSWLWVFLKTEKKQKINKNISPERCVDVSVLIEGFLGFYICDDGRLV